MPKNQLSHNIIGNLTSLSLDHLRQKWTTAWGREPHARIGRTMLIKSLEYKILEDEERGMTAEQRQRLNQLIKSYKRNPNFFDKNKPALKPGTRLVRNWNGKRYSVLVQNEGYDYKGKTYSSLSQVAFEITGTRWNGWVFFALKKREVAA